MKVIVEDMSIGGGGFLPDGIEPVLGAEPGMYAFRLEAAAKAAASGDAAAAAEAGRAAARAIALRERVEAVMLPAVLRFEGPTEAEVAAMVAFSWEAECRGLLVLYPFDDDRGLGVMSLPENVLTWKAMREPHPVRRAELWLERWDAVLHREKEAGGRSSERGLVAGLVADDSEARWILRYTRPEWLMELDAERQGAQPIRWRKEMEAMERLPAA
ncbi:protein of unknown function (plasmid) [Magnetospirillum sp. XM-1]|uniref:hypothetical protein n=1 Tax=Magnetospirillum sp. XM-1 TaxID=1663591 RepID=UPI00073DDF23|nr:hypothetical protein [Magnetospirillum sp. XM-1]CUW41898.1 protein of unknown function [Magnetospirillum sp. XM-1]